MAYLRWSDSNWYAYRHIDGGDGPKAIFMARYGTASGLSVCLSAGEMQKARENDPSRWLQAMINSLPGGDGVPQEDVAELHTVAEQFLHEVFMAGLIPMPRALARRYRVLRRLVRRRVNRPLPPPEAVPDSETEADALARL